VAIAPQDKKKFTNILLIAMQGYLTYIYINGEDYLMCSATRRTTPPGVCGQGYDESHHPSLKKADEL
jgi:hypothetical protein